MDKPTVPLTFLHRDVHWGPTERPKHVTTAEFTGDGHRHLLAMCHTRVGSAVKERRQLKRRTTPLAAGDFEFLCQHQVKKIS